MYSVSTSLPLERALTILEYFYIYVYEEELLKAICHSVYLNSSAMYQRIVTLVILAVSPVFCDDCASEFDILTNHYYELGCTPVSDQSGVIDQLSAVALWHIRSLFSTNKCFGSLFRFQCPDFESFDKEKCHLFGKVYNPHDIIDMDNIPRKICVESCFCGPRYLLKSILLKVENFFLLFVSIHSKIWCWFSCQIQLPLQSLLRAGGILQ